MDENKNNIQEQNAQSEPATRQETKNESEKTKIGADPLEFYRSEIKRIAKERDAFKQKLKELEGLKTIEQEYQNLKSEYENLLKSLKEKEEAKKNILLEQLKNDKEAFDLAQKIENLEALEKFVNLYNQKTKNVIISNTPTLSGNTKQKSWDDYSSLELAKIKKENPDLYKQLYRQKFSK